MTLSDKLIPNPVGADIGCGMHTARLKEMKIDMPKLDFIIRKNIPSGGQNRKTEGKYAGKLNLQKLYCISKYKAPVKQDLAYRSNGTLGGGNHFIIFSKNTLTSKRSVS